MSIQGIFRGLSDPTRRDILKLLANGEMSIVEVADQFDITRTAVKKHLQILQDGDLISVRTEGRTRMSTLNPAALRRADDWIRFFDTFWQDRFNALDAALRADMEGEIPVTDSLTKTAFFPAPREMVWAYLTDKDLLGKWYHPARADLRQGAPYELYKTGDDGQTGRIVWGHVIRMDPPHEMICTFEVSPFEDRETTLTWTLEALVGGTRLTLRHDGIVDAAGEAANRMFAALDKGWDDHIAALRNAAQTEVA